MTQTMPHQLALLHRLTLGELRLRYAELFHEPAPSGNRTRLIRRLAWRLQALAEGDLSERARRRAAELANDADLRLYPPQPSRAKPRVRQSAPAIPGPALRDLRLPRPGTILTRSYKGQTLQVTVLEDGFAFEGTRYGSLSALAKAITGSHCNGRVFFGLSAKGGKR